MTEHRRYEHDPERGETRSPTKEGGRDPHEPATRPESQTPRIVGRTEQMEAMGSRPPAHGERKARSPMPDEND